MPEVQNREAAEQKLRIALTTVWKTWTDQSDPTQLNARDLLTLLQQHTYQPLWEVYYLAQHTISQQLRIPTSEQLIAAAFLLYYTQWANDIVSRWVSRVSSWVLEARIAAHSKQREQQTGEQPPPAPPATPAAGKRPATATPSTAGSSPLTVPTRTENPTPPPVVIEVPGVSPDKRPAAPPTPAPSVQPEQGKTAPQATPLQPNKQTQEPTTTAKAEPQEQAETPAKPISIADEIASRWKKEKKDVVDDGAIETYARDGVTSTNSQGELLLVDNARTNGRRIEAIWTLDPSSNWCRECYALDGTTREVWGAQAPNGPQLHPRCACSLRYIEVDENGSPIDYTPMRDQPF